jgi:choice-of-anchor C domain-containing protein
MKRLRLLIAAVVIFGLGLPAEASIVTNGSFEDGYNPPTGTYRTLYAADSSYDDITGWTVIGNSIDWICTYWQPAAGIRSLDLAGLGNGGVLANQVTTVVGQQYALTFAMAGNPDSPSGQKVKTMIVTVDGVVNQEFTFDTTDTSRTNMGWAWHSIAFTADSTSTILMFQNKEGQTPAYYGAALDDVSIVATSTVTVPEPATIIVWSLLGVASWLGLGVCRRGRRVGRPAWSEENRAAIVGIIQRGQVR